jgi:hypothetical protein
MISLSGADGSRKVSAQVDPSGTGKNFVKMTVTDNGDPVSLTTIFPLQTYLPNVRLRRIPVLKLWLPNCLLEQSALAAPRRIDVLLYELFAESTLNAELTSES